MGTGYTTAELIARAESAPDLRDGLMKGSLHDLLKTAR
jgi:hypothetical protein